MKISIITVVYNNEKTILDAVESVLGQTYKDIEYVIIDGGSVDGTVQLIDKFKDRIDYFVSERDKGLYDAMNKGIRAASGDIIGILNSDDLYQDTNVIRDVMLQFDDNPILDIVYGDLAYVKSNFPEHIVRKWKSDSYYPRYFEHGKVPPHPSLFLRREIYNQVGLFDLEYNLAADYEFMLRIFKKFHFKSKYLPRLMVRMRLGGATNKSIGNIVKGNLEILRAWRKNGFKAPFYLMPLRIIRRILQFI